MSARRAGKGRSSPFRTRAFVSGAGTCTAPTKS